GLLVPPTPVQEDSSQVAVFTLATLGEAAQAESDFGWLAAAVIWLAGVVAGERVSARWDRAYRRKVAGWERGSRLARDGLMFLDGSRRVYAPSEFGEFLRSVGGPSERSVRGHWRRRSTGIHAHRERPTRRRQAMATDRAYLIRNDASWERLRATITRLS